MSMSKTIRKKQSTKRKESLIYRRGELPEKTDKEISICPRCLSDIYIPENWEGETIVKCQFCGESFNAMELGYFDYEICYKDKLPNELDPNNLPIGVSREYYEKWLRYQKQFDETVKQKRQTMTPEDLNQ